MSWEFEEVIVLCFNKNKENEKCILQINFREFLDTPPKKKKPNFHWYELKTSSWVWAKDL